MLASYPRESADAGNVQGTLSSRADIHYRETEPQEGSITSPEGISDSSDRAHWVEEATIRISSAAVV